MTIKNTQIAQELVLPPVKIHCSILAEDAIKAAIEDYRRKHSGQPAVSATAAVTSFATGGASATVGVSRVGSRPALRG